MRIMTIACVAILIVMFVAAAWWPRHCVEEYAPRLLQTDDKIAIAIYCRR
ncbi:MAG: hypothetical protein J0H39_13910 [Alphaproteobacteria bacterium]|nr:hypothetical protein [Alphaproteobacteria bacterium]